MSKDKREGFLALIRAGEWIKASNLSYYEVREVTPTGILRTSLENNPKGPSFSPQGVWKAKLLGITLEILEPTQHELDKYGRKYSSLIEYQKAEMELEEAKKELIDENFFTTTLTKKQVINE
jgi:hypothetical protein